MVNRVTLLNENTEKLTAEDLTVKIGCKGVEVTGFFDHTKASEQPCRKSVWVLVTMDDHQVLGEKPTVAVFATEQVAQEAMAAWIMADCQALEIDLSCVECSPGGEFAYTKDGRLSWEITEYDVEESV